MEVIMNERINRLREELFSSTPAICAERAVIFTESMKKSEGAPIAKRRAEALYDVLDRMTIYVRDGELLVGNQSSTLRGAPVFPEYSVNGLQTNSTASPIISRKDHATSLLIRWKQKRRFWRRYPTGKINAF